MGTPEPLRWLSRRPATLSAAPAITPTARWGLSGRQAPAEAGCPLSDLGGEGRGGGGARLKGAAGTGAQGCLAEKNTETE